MKKVKKADGEMASQVKDSAVEIFLGFATKDQAIVLGRVELANPNMTLVEAHAWSEEFKKIFVANREQFPNIANIYIGVSNEHDSGFNEYNPLYILQEVDKALGKATKAAKKSREPSADQLLDYVGSKMGWKGSRFGRPTGSCDCSCHRDGGIHMVACCNSCLYCGMTQMTNSEYASHVKTCSKRPKTKPAEKGEKKENVDTF